MSIKRYQRHSNVFLDSTMIDGLDLGRALFIGSGLLMLIVPGIFFQVVYLMVSISFLQVSWDPVVWERQPKVIRIR